MRMRKKKWARPELNACSYYIPNPQEMQGHWKDLFPKKAPFHIELGCGKGVSTAQMTLDNQNINYLAVDIISDVLATARRNISRAYEEARLPVDNVRITSFDVMLIEHYIAPEDEVERIYISFCNPWTEKTRHEKRRLTHPRQLKQFRNFLKADGEIWFKTDDETLFDASLEYFAQCGFESVYLTRDLHASGFAPNYISEHEKMFLSEGKNIFFVIARMKA